MAVVDKKHSVLVLCDDYWHPAEIPLLGLQPLEKSGKYIFEWIENANDWSEEQMMKYRLVILTKSNNISSADQTAWMTAEVEAAFLHYVHAGYGLLIIHSGTAGYRDQTTLRHMTGGAFASHPEQCLITVTAKTENLLNMGTEPFTIFDEHYFMDLDDENARVFLTTSSEHGIQPAGWTRNQGTGRVCVLTPGHNLEVWLHPMYQVLIEKAMLWCRGTK